MKPTLIFAMILAGSPVLADCPVRGLVGTDWSKRSHKPYYAERILQISLNRFGPVQTGEDGSMGPSTRRTIKAYQQAQGIEQTGKADVQTLRALGADWAKTTPVPVITDTPNGQVLPVPGAVDIRVMGGDCVVQFTPTDAPMIEASLDFKADLTGCRLTEFRGRPTYVRNLGQVGIMVDVKSDDFGFPGFAFETPVVTIWPDGLHEISGIEYYEARATQSNDRKGAYPDWDGPYDNKGFAFHQMRKPSYISLGHNQWSWCPWN